MIEKIGWLLVHTIWQFSLWALVAFLSLKFFRRSSAAVRYHGLLGLLLLLTLTPVVSWMFLPTAATVAEHEVSNSPLWTDDTSPSGDLHLEAAPFQNPERPPNQTRKTAGKDSVGKSGSTTIDEHVAETGPHDEGLDRVTLWSHTIQQVFAPRLNGIVGIWFTGVLLFSLRPLSGWNTMRRLSTKQTSTVPSDLLKLLRETAESLGVTQAVRIFQSSLVTVPLVTGVLRPTILLPASIVTGLPPVQLRAILAHELAHIRRHDQLVNLWQTLVETVFFYHPLVWWLSHQIRCERENCCDDLAVSVSGGQIEYSRALLAVEDLRGTASALMLSSHGGSLSSRIRRLVTGEPSRHRFGVLSLVATLVLLAGIGVTYLCWNVDDHSLASLKAMSERQSDPPMPLEEQAAWDTLDSLRLTIHGAASHRLFLRRNLKELEHQKYQLNYSWPEEMLQRKRGEVDRPIHHAGFFDVPQQAWPHIAQLQSLRELSFLATDLRGKPMEIIGQLKNLRSIELTNGECYPADLVHLKNLSQLESVELMLSVFGNNKEAWIEQRGELTAAEQRRLEELVSQRPPDKRSRYRDIVITALYTDRAIRELSSLENLRSFKLINAHVTGASLQSLSKLPKLEEIELSVVGITATQARALGQIQTLRSFSQAQADNETLKALSTLSNLEELELWADGVNNDGVPHLLKLPNLRKLELRGSRLNDAGLLQLTKLVNLEYLDIKHSDGDLTLAGVLAFQEQKPNCTLRVDENLPFVLVNINDGTSEEETEIAIPVLERKVSLTATKMPLRDALRKIALLADVELELNVPALSSAKLNILQPVDAHFENLPLHEALGELIDWSAHPGVFRKVLGGKLLLTTLTAERERVERHIPEWLEPFLNNGMLANLDENNEVEELYFGDKLTDDLLVMLKTLPQLRSLNIGPTDELTAEGISHLGDLKTLQRLEVSNVNQSKGMGDEILSAIVPLKSLRELSVNQCGTTDAGIRYLEEMPQLTSLSVYSEGLLTDACLSSITKLGNLQKLSMNSYVATAQYGWMKFSSEALEQFSALRNLEELHLAGQPLPADSFALTKLKSLDVSGEQVDDDFVNKLAQCRELRRLNLGKTNVTDAGLKQISELPELRKLGLFAVPITDEGLRVLTNSPKLEHLELRNLKISDAGIGYVGKTNTLTRLDLYACTQTTVDGLEQLKSLPKLQTLYLTNFPDQAGYRGLSKLKHLRELSFMSCGILYEDWEWLKTEMPRTQIHHMTGGGGFSMWKPEVPEVKVKRPQLPEKLRPEAD